MYIKDEDENWIEVTINDIQITKRKCEVGIFTNGKGVGWVKTDDFSLIEG